MSEYITTDTEDAAYRARGHQHPKRPSGHQENYRFLLAPKTFPNPPEYEINGKNVCLILNHFNYEFKKGNPSPLQRKGTEVDVRIIRDYFQNFGFSVEVVNDANFQEIKNTLNDYASGKHGTNIGCFVCFVLTHGQNNKLAANDTAYEYDELYTPFLSQNCQFLIGKPKIFVINACQDDPKKGKFYDPGNKVYFTDSSDIPIHTPEDDDYLVALSSVPGFTTMRSERDGSFFIQCLFECLEANRKKRVKEDFVSVLTNVNRLVAVDVSGNHARFTQLDPKLERDTDENRKQMPIFFETLREQLFI